MDQFKSQFEERPIIRDGLILYKKDDILDIIEHCRNYNIAIFWIDAFYLTETSIQPSIENSINYSSTNKNYHDYDGALKFIAEREEYLFFEIVCE